MLSQWLLKLLVIVALASGVLITRVLVDKEDEIPVFVLHFLVGVIVLVFAVIINVKIVVARVRTLQQGQSNGTVKFAENRRVGWLNFIIIAAVSGVFVLLDMLPESDSTLGVIEYERVSNKAFYHKWSSIALTMLTVLNLIGLFTFTEKHQD